MQAHLERAIETARAGHRQQARELLIFILREDPRNVVAWKWFATVASDDDEIRTALRNILVIDPADQWATDALVALDARAAGGKRRGVGPAVAVGLAILVVGLCAASLALVLAGPNIDTFGLPFLNGRQQPTPLVVSAGGDLSPPTLPPTWTPAATPTLPTLTPQPTHTETPTPGPTVTKVPTPEAVDAPPESQVDQVPQDQLVGVSGSVVTSESYVYYPVSGSNADEINQSILQNGPSGGGQDAIAQIAYVISLHYTVLEGANVCAPEGAVAVLDMEFTYPEFQPQADTSQLLLNQWNNFLARVITHEETHADIATDCAQNMVDDFLAMPSTTSCSQLQAQIQVMQSNEDAACDARQFAFDQAEGGDSFP